MARSVAFVLSLWVAVSMAAAQEPPVAGSGGVPVPRRLRTVQPEYPPEALAAGQRGIVVLELTIDARGRVSDVKVIRSVAPFDDAAMAAVRLWEYEPVTVQGRQTPVRLTVPVSFALRLPDVSRQPGIPELRAGGTPTYPSDGKGRRAPASVSITISPSGEILEMSPAEGEEPFAEALMKAARTWRFVPLDGEETATFRLEADFAPPEGENRGAIGLRLTGLHREVPVTAAGRVARAAEAQGVTPPTKPTEVSAPAPAPASLPAEPRAAEPTPAAPQPTRPAPPTVETIAAPPPPARIVEAGAPAIRDIRFEGQIPDLIRGRRPVVPPMARINAISGDVTVSFSVDAAGVTLVRSIDGPEALKKVTEELVGSWAFRRLSPERIFLSAVIAYKGDVASAVVRPQGQ